MRHEWKRSIPWEPPGCVCCSRVSSLQGLLMPRLTSSPLNVSYAHLRMQPAAFASSPLFSRLLPSSVGRQRRHPGRARVWGSAGGCAGIDQGDARPGCGRGWEVSPGTALARREVLRGQEIGSLVSDRVRWGLGTAGSLQVLEVSWGSAVGLGGSLLSCGMTPTSQSPQIPQDSSGTGGTDKGALLHLQAAGGCPRAHRFQPTPVPRISWILHTPICRCVLPDTSLCAGVSWETPQGAAAFPQLGKLGVPLS